MESTRKNSYFYADFGQTYTVPGIKIVWTHSYSNASHIYVAGVSLITTTSISDGDLNLLTNQNPMKPQVRMSEEWIDKQFLKIGESKKVSGVMGNPITYSFNGKSTIFKTGVALATPYVLTHNIGCEIKPPSGFFNNITGASGLTNGSSGYVIGMGASSGGIDYSNFGLVNSKTLTLYGGQTALWLGANSNGNFSGADAVIYCERSF